MAVGYLSVTLPRSMASSQKPGGSGGASGSHQGRACRCCGHQLSFLLSIKTWKICSIAWCTALHAIICKGLKACLKIVVYMFILIETLVGMFHMSMQYTYFAHLSRNKAHRQYLKKRSPLAHLLQDVPQFKTNQSKLVTEWDPIGAGGDTFQTITAL